MAKRGTAGGAAAEILPRFVLAFWAKIWYNMWRWVGKVESARRFLRGLEGLTKRN